MTQAMIANTAQQIEIFLGELKRKSPRTRGRYRVVAERFLTTCGDFSRQGMMKYLESLGYCDNSIRPTYYILKRLCRALSIPFPLDTDLLPPIPDEDEIHTPTMKFDSVARMIYHWRQLPNEYVTSLVFLSTIYGLRSIEMSTGVLQPIQVKSGSFTMTVAKRKNRGDKPVIREHLIPSGMDVYLSGFTLKSERSVEYSFITACRAIGYHRQDHENWHAIRRALDTAFIDSEIDHTLIKRFMRWTKGRADMPNVYYHKDFTEVNQEMFKVHPFLPLWG